MALPSFVSTRNVSRKSVTPPADSPDQVASTRERDGSVDERSTSNPVINIKRATRVRKFFAITTSCFFFLSVLFLILVEIGNVTNKAVLRETYFIKIDVSNIIPRSVPNAVLINSLARSIGLRDFYQVGLWNYCEGYNDQGITFCSKSMTLFWFNPVEIIKEQLFAGATIALPAEITSALKLVRLASRWMFSLYLMGAIFSTISIFITFVAVYSRWWSLALSIITGIAAISQTIASVIATVMWIIFRNVFSSAPEINIEADLSIRMFTFMWIASAFAILGWLVHVGMCCCCASRRDVRTGRRKGSKKGYVHGVTPSTSEEKTMRRRLGFRKKI